jgi:hypothetical protein
MHVKSEGRVDWFSLQSKLSPAMHGCGLDHHHDWMGQKVGHCPQLMNNSWLCPDMFDVCATSSGYSLARRCVQ